MSQHAIKLVCFDLGGVVVRICRSWAEGCAHAGVEVRGDSDTEARKRGRREVTREFSVGRIDEATWVDRIVTCLDGMYTHDEILRIHEAWIIDEYPGVGSVIDAIHERGCGTACLSNTNAGHWDRQLVTADEVLPSVMRLETLHASHLMGLAKPDPAIYHAFVEATNVAPNSILFFDDLPDNVEAARAAGWHAERIDHTRESTAPQIRKHLEAYGVL